MSIKRQAEMLKKFIEICEEEHFPNNTLDVHILNQSVLENTNTASYNHGYYIKFLLLPFAFLVAYLYGGIVFFFKRSLQNRHNIMIACNALRFIKIILGGESYFITKQKHLQNMNAVRLAGIAYHEVRHRFQHYYIKGKMTKRGQTYENKQLLSIYEAGRESAIESLTFKKIKKDQLELECDALFVQHIFTKYLTQRFPDGNINEKDFRAFVRENKNLLIWENPYLKQQ